MTDENSHAPSLMATLRQAKDDGDLPDELAEKYDLEDDDQEGSDDE
jgi:hypothetical protein